MKNPDTPRNTSRRSFMKKSVVAAVAASNLTMFSGLVNAQGESSSPGKSKCIITHGPSESLLTLTGDDGNLYKVATVNCYLRGCDDNQVPCGSMFVEATQSPLTYETEQHPDDSSKRRLVLEDVYIKCIKTGNAAPNMKKCIKSTAPQSA